MTDISLNKLTAWEGNVRKTQNKGSIDELAASIKAHGLQQNLVVKKDGKNYAVIAGGRRLAALQKLAKDGDIAKDFAVPCQIVAEDANLSELSLVENTVRENMHPADECEAFTKLAEDGMELADIAARFGKTERYVQQRMKLARGLSKKVLKTFREGKMTMRQLEAFTVTDDFDAQDELLAQIGDIWEDSWVSEPDNIRENLTERNISGKDRRVRYVGLEAYEKAGGKLTRDLFGEDADIYILDEPILDKLAADKLAKSAKTVEKEGWKWVEVHANGLRPDRNGLNTIFAHKGKWTKEQLSYAGAVVRVGFDGKAEIERGLVRKEDMPQPKKAKAKKGSAATATDDADEAGDDQPSGLSAPLLQDLTTEYTLALSAELAQRPDIALAAVVHTMAADIILEDGWSALQIRGSRQSCSGFATGEAGALLAREHQKWGEQVPGDSLALWKWCLEQDREVLLELLSYCAARTLNAVRTKNDRLSPERFSFADHLARELKLDMTKWFTPTAENYFSRVGKDQIAEAINDVKGTLPGASVKKAAAATMAEQAVAGKGWLPKVLRAAS